MGKAFKDVTEKAGLEGQGYETGVAVGDYDNDGCEDIYIAGLFAISSIITTAMAPLPM